MKADLDVNSLVLNNIPAIVYVVDIESYQILYMNEYSIALFGDFVGRNCCDLLHGEKNIQCEGCREFVDKGKDIVTHQEIEILSKRTKRWYHLNITPVKWKDGKFARLEVAFDITVQKESRIKEFQRPVLSENDSVVSDIINFFNSIDYFQNKIVNTLSLIAAQLKMNTAVLAGLKYIDGSTYNYSYNDPQGPLLSGLLRTALDKEPIKTYLNYFQNQAVYTFHKDDANLFVPHFLEEFVKPNEIGSLFVFPIKLESIIYGVLFFASPDRNKRLSEEEKIFMDIVINIISNALIRNVIENEIMESQISLKKLNATKDKFFSIIAHDLRNPFHAITGFSQMLLDRKMKMTDEERENIIRIILDSSTSASALLENLLQWSRTQTDSIKCDPQHFEIQKVVLDVISLFRINAHRKQITFEVAIDESLIVFADRNMTSTIIQNLINNAIKFTKDSGLIKISANYVKGIVDISVEDNGVGMEEKTRSTLFSVDKTTVNRGTSGEKGTGLGLIICKEFTERNKGSIKVETQLGKGTKIVFSLPIK